MSGSDVLKAIKAAKSVAIFGHANPDADSLGSTFAFRDLCRNFGRKAEVFGVKTIAGAVDEIFPIQQLCNNFVADEWDLIVVLDLHVTMRLDSVFVEEIKRAATAGKKLIVLDHHEISESEKDIELPLNNAIVIPEKAATCEILADILIESGADVSKSAATYLWAGLVGDTGRFLHSNLSENVLKVAQWLLHEGADAQGVYNKMFRSNSVRMLKLHGQFIQKMKFTANGRASFVIFTQKEMKKLDANRNDVKVFIRDLTNCEGCMLGFCATEMHKNHFKVSLRSALGVNTVPFATKFGGGGHEEASGFEVDCTARKLEKNIPIWAKEILQD